MNDSERVECSVAVSLQSERQEIFLAWFITTHRLRAWGLEGYADWEVDCDPTIVQLTDGLSCQEGIETELGWKVWCLATITYACAKLRCCRGKKTWGHMSVVVRARLLSPRMQLKCCIACWYQKTLKFRSYKIRSSWFQSWRKGLSYYHTNCMCKIRSCLIEVSYQRKAEP